jgi:hypothetical protein
MLNRLMVIVMGLALFSVMGLAGCKNTCEKAADHMKACMEDYCEEAEEGDPICAALNAEGVGQAPECTAENEAASAAMLELNCDQLFGRGGQ